MSEMSKQKDQVQCNECAEVSLKKKRTVAKHKLASHLVCSKKTAKLIAESVKRIQKRCYVNYSKQALIETIVEITIPEIEDAIIAELNGISSNKVLKVEFRPRKISVRSKNIEYNSDSENKKMIEEKKLNGKSTGRIDSAFDTNNDLIQKSDSADERQATLKFES